MVLAGVVGVLAVAAAAWFLTGLGGDDDQDPQSQPPTSAPPTSAAPLPVGVECSGADCAGKDPEAMGCGGEYAATSARTTVGTTLVEVRYSKVCGAAWARIQQGAAGDTVTISAASVTGEGGTQTEKLGVPGGTYTAMVPAKSAADVKACGTLLSGQKGCTETDPAQQTEAETKTATETVTE
ncbi:DUF2690 domain-containing protein [Streptomyces sp. O3]